MEIIKDEESLRYIINISQIVHSYVFISSISLIACIGIIALYFSSSTFKSFSFALMCCIAFTESISCISHILSFGLFYIHTEDEFKRYTSSSVLCGIQRYLYTGSDLASVLFIFFLTFSIYQGVKYNKNILEIHKKLIILLSFIIPFVFSGILLILFYKLKEFWSIESRKFFQIRPHCSLEGRGGIVLIAIHYLILTIFNLLIILYICKFNCFLKCVIDLNIEESEKLLNIQNKVTNFVYLNVFYWIFSFLQRLISEEKWTNDEIHLRLTYASMHTYTMFCGIRGLLFFFIFFNNSKVEIRVRELIEKYIWNNSYFDNFFKESDHISSIFQEIMLIPQVEIDNKESKKEKEYISIYKIKSNFELKEDKSEYNEF